MNMTSRKISRRKILELALASPVAAMVPDLIRAQDGQGRLSFLNAKSEVIPVAGADVSQVKLTRTWRGSVCHSQLVNRGRTAVRIKEVVLFDMQLPLPASTRLYGEGFQLLTQ